MRPSWRKELCQLNKQRQAIEAGHLPPALSPCCPPGKDASRHRPGWGPRWHQGVVGIVASRLAEEYSCPTFLICLDGEHGKASSRSYGGFNLFASLRDLADAAGKLRRARISRRFHHRQRQD